MTRAQRRTRKRRARRVGIIVASVAMLATTAGLSGSALAAPFIRDLQGQADNAPIDGEYMPSQSDDGLTNALGTHTETRGHAGGGTLIMGRGNSVIGIP